MYLNPQSSSDHCLVLKFHTVFSLYRSWCLLNVFSFFFCIKHRRGLSRLASMWQLQSMKTKWDHPKYVLIWKVRKTCAMCEGTLSEFFSFSWWFRILKWCDFSCSQPAEWELGTLIGETQSLPASHQWLRNISVILGSEISIQCHSDYFHEIHRWSFDRYYRAYEVQSNYCSKILVFYCYYYYYYLHYDRC